MDKAQALHNFWSSFDLTAYDENTVPIDAELPYITYEVKTSDFDHNVSITGSLWYRSTSWGPITQKAEEIYNEIGYGGITLPYDNGMLWITRGEMQRLNEQQDPAIRRIILQLNCEYI